VTRVDRISALVILAFGVLACLESVKMACGKGRCRLGFFPARGRRGHDAAGGSASRHQQGCASEERKPFMSASNELKQLSAFVPALCSTRSSPISLDSLPAAFCSSHCSFGIPVAMAG